jgi:hypothetical protein
LPVILIVEPCQLAMENGARRVMVPIENRRQFLEVSGDVAERLDPIFYGDAPVAANKVLDYVVDKILAILRNPMSNNAFKLKGVAAGK